MSSDVVARQEMHQYVKTALLKQKEKHNNELRHLKHEIFNLKKQVDHMTILFSAFVALAVGAVWFTYSKDSAWRVFNSRFSLLTESVNSIELRFGSMLDQKVGEIVKQEMVPLSDQYGGMQQEVDYLYSFVPVLPKDVPQPQDPILGTVEVFGRERGSWNDIINGVYGLIGTKNNFPFYKRKEDVILEGGGEGKEEKSLYIYHLNPGEVNGTKIYGTGEWFIGSKIWTDVSMARVEGDKHSPLSAHVNGTWKVFEGEGHNFDEEVKVLRGELSFYGRGKQCLSPLLASDRGSFDECRLMCDLDRNCHYVTFYESSGWCHTFSVCETIAEVMDQSLVTYKLRMGK